MIGRSEVSIENDRMFFVGELQVAKQVFLNRAAIVVKASLQFFVAVVMYIAIHAIRLDALNRSVARGLPLFEKCRGNADTGRR